jgi:heat shock protein HslJ
MMRFLGYAALMLVLGALVLTACTGRAGSLEGTLWKMTAYRNAEGEMVGSLPEVKTTAQFEDGNVSGNAGCNSYNGSYQVDGDEISFGPMMSTLMACPPPVMEQESGFMAALGMVATFEVSGETLTMIDEAGEVVLEFIAVEPPALVGTPWQLTSYNNGKGGMQSVIIGTEITAEFNEDETMTGSAGCNTYSAPFESTEDTISIGPTIRTEMACMDPDGVMEQENLYLAALQNAAVYKIFDDRLEIRDENGSGVAYYVVMP